MTTATNLAVHASALSKSFGPNRAVDSLDLAVPAGCVYGFLGPNGAGKTTTVRILATLLRPDSGSARVLGYDVVHQPDRVRELISLTGQFAALDDDLTARENLLVLGRLLGHRPAAARERAAELLDAFDLAAAADRPVKTHSGGMRRRLDIAASLIATPRLLFLDEPTTGLDPASRNQVWELIRALAAAGTSVLLTTQYLDEADRLAARIAVIDHGRLIAEGTPDELKAATGAGALRIRLAGPGRRDDAARLLTQALDLPVHGEGPAALSVPGAAAQQAATALAELARVGIPIAGFTHDQPNLDEVFLALTGHAASNGNRTEPITD